MLCLGNSLSQSQMLLKPPAYTLLILAIVWSTLFFTDIIILISTLYNDFGEVLISLIPLAFKQKALMQKYTLICTWNFGLEHEKIIAYVKARQAMKEIIKVFHKNFIKLNICYRKYSMVG